MIFTPLWVSKNIFWLLCERESGQYYLANYCVIDSIILIKTTLLD